MQGAFKVDLHKPPLHGAFSNGDKNLFNLEEGLIHSDMALSTNDKSN